MGLGLQLSGVFPSGPVGDGITLEALESWIRDTCGAVLREVRIGEQDGYPALLVDLHPAAETLDLVLQEDNKVVASAQTSCVGPGYHIYVCELIKGLTRKFDISWNTGSDDEGDETGYFESGDRSSLDSEMLAWLQAICDLVLRNHEFGPADVPIAMPLGVVYKANQFLVTQIGPRSREWAETVARDPIRGKNFFSWWNPERDADYYLNRAACLMWTAVRWRNPLVGSERQILNEVNENLQLAYRLNEALDYPWREWNEILKFLDAEVS